VTAFGPAGCGADPPIGLRKDGESLTVVLGRQCVTATYLRKLAVSTFDEKTHDLVTPPMWQIETQEPRPVPEVGIDKVPDGFVVTADNLATQAIDRRIEVSAYFGDQWNGAVFEVGDLRAGKILANGDQLSEKEFQDEYGCGG
jgi:hypothetical protein